MSTTPPLSNPPSETDPLALSPAPSAFERAKLRKAALQARAQEVADRAETARADHKNLDTMFEAFARDVEVGGGIIAGALAYRFFIWLLPFGLVLVAGLGLAADAANKSPVDAAKSLGFAGLVSQSVAAAASGSGRWYALLVGVPVLLYVTRSVLRALVGAHGSSGRTSPLPHRARPRRRPRGCSACSWASSYSPAWPERPEHGRSRPASSFPC